MRPPTPPLPEQARVNVADLRTLIVKRVGMERAEKYFRYLSRLLSCKMSKFEFNKMCIGTLGRENLPLHNQVVHSILKNAVCGRVAPVDYRCKSVPQMGWGNGGMLPLSPRKSRSGIRRTKDQHIPLRPNGRENLARGEESAVMENGNVGLYELKAKRLVQHPLGAAIDQTARPMQVEKLSTQNLSSVQTKDLVQVVVAEDREEGEQVGELKSEGGSLRAPLGIPFCPASVGGAQMPVPLPISSGIACNYVGGEQSHTEVIRRRMEIIAQAQGLGGVAVSCGNLLNSGLDAYLKQLIRTTVELVRARSGHRPNELQPLYKNRPQVMPINGVWSGSHKHVQSSAEVMEGMSKSRNDFIINRQDFRVAMELNPQQIGEDWPLLLEKICVSSFEE